MITGLLIAGASSLLQAGEPPPAPPPVRRSVARRVLDIPDEIAPAILPYLQCAMASRGVQQRTTVDGPIVRPAAPVGTDCSPRRTQAARRAEDMLRTQGRGDLAERRAFVERVLAGVDDFVAGAGRPPADPPAGDSDAQN
jgi:hypothetical protein